MALPTAAESTSMSSETWLCGSLTTWTFNGGSSSRRGLDYCSRWGRRDSNPHALLHMILSHARLPIPTLPHAYRSGRVGKREPRTAPILGHPLEGVNCLLAVGCATTLWSRTCNSRSPRAL